MTPVRVTSGEAALPRAILPSATVTVRVVPTLVIVMSAPSDSPSPSSTTTSTPRTRSSGVVLLGRAGSVELADEPAHGEALVDRGRRGVDLDEEGA